MNGGLEGAARTLPLLLRVLGDQAAPPHQVAAACALVGAIGDPVAVPALIARLSDDEDDFLEGVSDIAGRVLGSLGPPAADALLTVIEEASDARAVESSIEAFMLIAADHPAWRPRYAAACLGVLDGDTASDMARSLAATSLMSLDWREALPAIDRAVERGGFDQGLLRPQEIEAWRQGRRKHHPPLRHDWLGRFQDEHYVAFPDVRGGAAARRVHRAVAACRGRPPRPRRAGADTYEPQGRP